MKEYGKRWKNPVKSTLNLPLPRESILIDLSTLSYVLTRSPSTGSRSLAPDKDQIAKFTKGSFNLHNA